MNRLRLTWGLLPILFFPICSQAATLGAIDIFQTGGQNAGVPVFSFLKLPTSARNIGLAASVLTTDEEASIIQSNPAGLGLIQDYYYSLSHAEVLGEFRHENLAFTYPTEIYGNFGGSANILAATAFEEARDIDENPVHPTAYDMAIGMAYANSILEGRCTTGGRLDLIRSSLDGTVAYGYGLNAGIMFMLINDFRLALVIKNLSHGATYDTKTAPLEPLPLNVGMELGKPMLDSKWSGQLGVVQSNENLLHYYFGGEWKLRRYIILRMGYEGSTQDRQLGSWTGWGAGLGIKYERLTFDYGYKALGPLGAYHAFTLNYSRKSKFRTRDEILLEAAQERYRRGEYKRALKFAQAAVDANPYNFQAQALSQKLQLELDRINQSAIAIFYTANTDGNLAPEWKNGHAIGGMARRKTKLLELKGAQGKCLILDAGNLTAPKRLAGGEKFVYGAYAQMPYDAINLGSAEFIMGSDHWDPRLPFLSSQNPIKDIFPAILTEKKLKLKNGLEITVLGAMENFELNNPGAWKKSLGSGNLGDTPTFYRGGRTSYINSSL